ncbi:nucleotidyltransferase domain-containing protein [Mycobacterium marinum]|uniref:nucleotidyltransferase domain-containing protein n=1 Tax=Mycobacterium marinum TaxID=1781 RepID=UPI001921CB17|nr:nucleotidyltransferase domain-containing protein [Mycobacterium marinum]QQW33527.1 nucleotidyltransferase domain-containing protein [Mycobacterium marinum]
MDLVEAIAHLGLVDSVPGLSAAIERSKETIARMRAALEGFDTGGMMDVVAFGSLARQEYTPASDIDYLVVVNGVPRDPAAARTLLQRVEGCVADESRADGAEKAPGTSGLFGKAIGIFDIINQVGLEGDTNSTHTIRMEIVQESVSLLNNELHSRIVGSTLSRYITLFDVPQGSPPRFLLNDMLRYWRQITVDYQAKAPIGGMEPKAVLRYLKLLTTRKNLFASSILPLIAPRDNTISWEDYLREIYAVPPLARLATVTKDAPEKVIDAVRTVFSAIDLFIQETDSAEKRERWKIPWETRKSDADYNKFRVAANKLQRAFEYIFLDWPAVADNTRRYLLL